jgi:hypothetical protein
MRDIIVRYDIRLFIPDFGFKKSEYGSAYLFDRRKMF